MEQADFDRLTLLERAQWLHDSTLKRHGEMLDRHEASLMDHAAHMARLDALTAQLAEIAIRLELHLEAIREMLRHRDGGS